MCSARVFTVPDKDFRWNKVSREMVNDMGIVC